MELDKQKELILNHMNELYLGGANIIDIILSFRMTSFYSTAVSVSKIELLKTINVFIDSKLTKNSYQLNQEQKTIFDYMKDQYSSYILDILELIYRMEVKPIYRKIINLTSEEKNQIIKSFVEWSLNYEKEWALFCEK